MYITTSIHIAFGINNLHSKYIRVIINSIGVNNTDSIIYIHILHDGISSKNTKKLNREITRFSNIEVTYYKIDPSQFSGIVTKKWHVSAWYRILIPKLLPKNINRVLYLDSDTLINGSLKNLYNINLNNYSLAAVTDILNLKESILKRLPMIKSNIYVCTGVMLLNLEFWRKNNLSDKILKFAFTNPDLLIYPDQDAINVICDGKIKLLPLEYGYVLDFVTKRNSIIFHYGKLKPWIFIKNCHYYSIWKKYNDSLINPINLILPTFKVNLKEFIFKIYKILTFKIK